VSEGSTILLLETDGVTQPAIPAVHSPPPPTHPHSGVAEVRVPDIGDFKDVPIIEIMVKPGDKVKAEDPLITLESDKATMDIPAPLGGTVQELKAKVGDKVSEGAVILTLATESAAASPQRSAAPPTEVQAKTLTSSPSPARGEGSIASAQAPSEAIETGFVLAYASPAVRKLARELGVDLVKVKGSGDKGRILKEDVETHAKGGAAPPAVAPAGAGVGLDLLPWPKVDFAKFGPIEAKPLARIKKISGANLHRNWVMIPHVTNNEDADITDLETFRVQMNKEHEKAGIKVTMLAFLIKAAVASLKKFPEFNASLDGDNLIFKKYYHIGFAADTPNGLVVPVVKDADKKGVLAIAKETSELAKQARDGKLKPADMQGGCFSISSLGGIGGTYFTPIINAPEVAILGVCRSSHRPVWDGKQFAPRLILPLSLSYDHRVIDGAAAARFNSFFAGLLADMRRAML
ncbi:MAG: dihydrolipoyllysine-residue acetyltransferase, partial [Burkholderiales bacterium]